LELELFELFELFELWDDWDDCDDCDDGIGGGGGGGGAICDGCIGIDDRGKLVPATPAYFWINEFVSYELLFVKEYVLRGSTGSANKSEWLPDEYNWRDNDNDPDPDPDRLWRFDAADVDGDVVDADRFNFSGVSYRL
jgi:hypothetical protein